MEPTEGVDSTEMNPRLNFHKGLPLSRALISDADSGYTCMLSRYLDDIDCPLHGLRLASLGDLEDYPRVPGQNPPFRVHDLVESTQPLRGRRKHQSHQRGNRSLGSRQSMLTDVASSSSFETNSSSTTLGPSGSTLPLAMDSGSAEPAPSHQNATLCAGCCYASKVATSILPEEARLTSNHQRSEDCPSSPTSPDDALAQGFGTVLQSTWDSTNQANAQHCPSRFGRTTAEYTLAVAPVDVDYMIQVELTKINATKDGFDSVTTGFSEGCERKWGDNSPELQSIGSQFDSLNSSSDVDESVYS